MSTASTKVLGLPRRGLAVLLAEDDAELRSLLAQALRGDGAFVVAVSSGDEILRELDAGLAPNVLVSDVRMPRMSGLAVLRELRRRGSELPVVLITGFGESVDPAEILELGGAVVLEKPFDLDDLRTALLNLGPISRRGRRLDA